MIYFEVLAFKFLNRDAMELGTLADASLSSTAVSSGFVSSVPFLRLLALRNPQRQFATFLCNVVPLRSSATVNSSGNSLSS